MDDQQQIYLIATFPDMGSLAQATRSLGLPTLHMAVLGATGAHQWDSDLQSDIPLDPDQEERLAWHLAHDKRPMLAVRVLAVNGRDLRLRLTALGAEMLAAPHADVQANDADIDPGTVSDEPELSPNHGRLSDANSTTGEPNP